jgi:hypothetical protein
LYVAMQASILQLGAGRTNASQGNGFAKVTRTDTLRFGATNVTNRKAGTGSWCGRDPPYHQVQERHNKHQKYLPHGWVGLVGGQRMTGVTRKRLVGPGKRFDVRGFRILCII